MSLCSDYSVKYLDSLDQKLLQSIVDKKLKIENPSGDFVNIQADENGDLKASVDTDNGVNDLNSTSTFLVNGAMFTGTWVNVEKFSQFTHLLRTDQSGIVYFDVSTDGVNMDASKPVTFTNFTVNTLVITGKFMRVRILNNSGSDQTFLRAQTSFHKTKNKNLTSTLSQPLNDQNDVENVRATIVAKDIRDNYTNVRSDFSGNLNMAEVTNEWTNLGFAEVFENTGDVLSLKSKTIFKFGRNQDLDSGVFEEIWAQGGIETYATSNSIDTIVSTDALDVYEVIIEGHTLSGSEFTFVTQTVTLTGQTDVALPTPLARCSRVTKNNGTEFVGLITVFDDTAGSSSSGIVTPVAAIHCEIAEGEQTSQKAATTFSNVDYGFITEVSGGPASRTSALLEFKLQIRKFGKVFLTKYQWGTSGGSVVVQLEPYIIVPKNADIRILGKSNTNNTEAFASFSAIIGEVQV